MRKLKLVAFIAQIVVLAAPILFTGCKKNQENDRTWSVYKANAGSSNYSPLDQINVSNVAQLKSAWAFNIADFKHCKRKECHSAFQGSG